MKPQFQIGDKVFKARYAHSEKFVTCPDCLGSKTVRVILADNTELTIECGGCDPGGYEPPTGRIRQYEYQTVVSQHTVTGVSTRSDGVEYELDHYGNSYWTAKEGEIFPDREGAEACGERQRLEHEAAQNKQLMSKTKDARSWAWNASYHRKQIAEHERQLEYHRKKVQICAAKAKKST